MKKITTVVLIILCAAGLFAQQNAQFGEITEFSGTVEIKRAGQANFIPAKAGDTLAKDTIISTGFRSTALIRAGSTVLTVRPITRLSLSEIMSSTGAETLNVNLQVGRVKVDVNPPAGTRASMTIQSPMATASVRGTSFEFDTQSITVLEGTVTFQGSGNGYVLVSAGSTSEINANGSPMHPIETFTAQLWPSQPAGSDTGFISNGGGASPGASESNRGFGLEFELR